MSSSDFPYEEFAPLIGATVPGSTRNHVPGTRDRAYFRNGEDNFIDIAMADALHNARPSGVILPKILQQKLSILGKEKHAINEESEQEIDDDEQAKSSKSSMDQYGILSGYRDVSNILSINHINKFFSPHNKNPKFYKNINPLYVFTEAELKTKLVKANTALIELQKQLWKGEELYFQETDGHGNLYRGWDAFVDFKADNLGIESSAIMATTNEFLGGNEIISGGGAMPNYCSIQGNAMHRSSSSISSMTPSRRMPADHRWFSSSSLTLDSGRPNNSGKAKRSVLGARLSSVGSFHGSGGDSATSSASVSPVPSNNCGVRTTTISTNNGTLEIPNLKSSTAQISIPHTPILSNVSTKSSSLSVNAVRDESHAENLTPQSKMSAEVETSPAKSLSRQLNRDISTHDFEIVRDKSVTMIASNLNQEMHQETSDKSDKVHIEPMKIEKGSNSKTSTTKGKKCDKHSKSEEFVAMEITQKKNSGVKSIIPSDIHMSVDLTKQSIPRKKKKMDEGTSIISTLVIKPNMKRGISSRSNSPLLVNRDNTDSVKNNLNSNCVRQNEDACSRTSSRKKSRKRKSNDD